MHYLFKILNSFIARISEFILLFSQVISLQIVFYPIVLLSLITNFNRLIRNKLTIIVVVFIFSIVVSIYLRGGEVELNLKMIQYYLGVLLVTVYFKINKKISIESWLIYGLVGLVFFEVISTNIFSNLPFFYDDPSKALYNLAIDQLGFARAQTGIGFYRAFGPALNSSISGSMLVVLFFILFDKRKDGVPMHLIVLVFSAFVLSASNTAVAVFLFMWIMHFLKKLQKRTILSLVLSFIKFFSLGLIFLAFCLLLYFAIELLFGFSFLKNPFSVDSILFVFNQKLYGLTHLVAEAENIFFGRNLSIEVNQQIGGDSQLFNMIQNLGLYGLFGLFSILFWVSEKGTRIYIIGGFIATMHYGALFSLAGQFFYAAVASNAIMRKSCLN